MDRNSSYAEGLTPNRHGTPILGNTLMRDTRTASQGCTRRRHILVGN